MAILKLIFFLLQTNFIFIWLWLFCIRLRGCFPIESPKYFIAEAPSFPLLILSFWTTDCYYRFQLEKNVFVMKILSLYRVAKKERNTYNHYFLSNKGQNEIVVCINP